MTSPTDPNKALLSEQAVIDRAQSTYGLGKGTTAKVHDGQIVASGGGFVRLSVARGEVTAAPAATVPNAPTSPVATPGDAQASVAFVAPVVDGGDRIIRYTVTSTPGGKIGTGEKSPIIVPGLTNGQAYTFKVKATNGVGTGAESAASASATPSA